MRLVKIVIVILLLPVSVFCQISEEDKEVDDIIDNLLGSDNLINDLIKSTTNYQMLQVEANYNDKTYFSGRDIGINQFNFVPQISYMHSKGFFASISGMYYSEFFPHWDYTSLSVGYGKNFGREQKFYWSTSYSRYIYSNEIENPFENAVTASISYNSKKKIFGSAIETSFLFGEETSFQLTSTTFIDFKLYEYKELELNIKPQLEILVAQQTIEQARIEIKGKKEETSFVEYDEFGLLNTAIKIPIQISYKSFDVEFGYTLNIPNSLPNENSMKATGFLNLSLSYTFLFN